MRIFGKVFSRYSMVVAAVLFAVHSFSSVSAAQTRLKDIAQIGGAESMRLYGIGIVTGLQGTGDGTQITSTIQAHANLLREMGITVDAARLRQRNMAMVSIYADIPPFSKRGSKFDVIVSAMGDAQSLEGGVLEISPLTDIRTDVPVAFASGPVSIGGSNLQAGGAADNFPTTGRVPMGAQLQADMEQKFSSDDKITLNLNRADFTTAFRVAQSINKAFGENAARPIDPATIEITIDEKYKERQVEFIAVLEQLSVDTDLPAKVIINERTGTVIAGNDVKLSPVMITHGALTVAIRPPEGAPADQQAQQGSVVVLDSRTGGSVQDLAAALNALQVTPRDLIAIFQALKEHGALNAELEIL